MPQILSRTSLRSRSGGSSTPLSVCSVPPLTVVHRRPRRTLHSRLGRHGLTSVRVDRFEEFSKAVTEMTPEDFAESAHGDVHQVKCMWDPDEEIARRRAKIGRPGTVNSIHSMDSDLDEDHLHLMEQWDEGNHDRHRGVTVEAAEGKLGVFVRNGTTDVDIINICREKMYRKTGGVNEMRRTFHRLDPDGNGQISCYEFSQFLRQLNLNLTPAALRELVRVFDSDGDGYVDFEEFCKLVVPNDYVLNPKTNELQGVTRLTEDRSRRIDRPVTPRVNVGVDGDSRAGLVDPVLLVREKLKGRALSVDDGRPARQLRHVFRIFDPSNNGGIDDRSFERVLNQLNVYVNSRSLVECCDKFRRGEDGKIDYKRFMRSALLSADCPGFGPHVPLGRGGGRTYNESLTGSSPRGASGSTMRPGTAPQGTGKMYEPRQTNQNQVTAKIGQPRWTLGGRHSPR